MVSLHAPPDARPMQVKCQAVGESTCRLCDCQGGRNSEVLHRGSEEGQGLAKKITAVVNEVLSEEACAGPKSLSQVRQQQPLPLPELSLCSDIGNSTVMASLLAELKPGRMQGRHDHIVARSADQSKFFNSCML